MSVTGKLIRGLKWNAWRVDGKLPKDITKDANKLDDIDYYLKFIEGKDKKKIDDILLRIRRFETGIDRKGVNIANAKILAEKNKEKLGLVKVKEDNVTRWKIPTPEPKSVAVEKAPVAKKGGKK